jgi:hypothetical protein
MTRVPRCRMLDRLNNRCQNPSLDPDPKAVQICITHAARVMELVRETRRRRYATATTKETVR